jgi:HEAT repeat protein
LRELGPLAAEAIPALIAAAVDSDAAVRRAAGEALGRVDPRWPANPRAVDAIGTLIKKLGGRRSHDPQTASFLLSEIGPTALPGLIEALSDKEDDIRQVWVARTIGRIGRDAADAVPSLMRALESHFAHVRQAAAEALSQIGPASESAVPGLIRLLGDPLANVRLAAVRALTHVGLPADPEIPPLLGLLLDQDDEIREATVGALAQIGPTVIPSLVGLLLHLETRRPDGRLKLLEGSLTRYLEASWMLGRVERAWLEASWMLGRVERAWLDAPEPGDLDVIRRDLTDMVRNRSWHCHFDIEDLLRIEAAYAAVVAVIGEIGPEASDLTPVLILVLADSNPWFRRAAADSLGRIGPLAREALPALVRALADESEPVRRNVAAALARIDPDWSTDPEIRDAIPSLVEKLRHPGEAGQMAADGLVLIGPAAVSVLSEALTADDRVLREAAATTLGRIGPKARAAIPTLVRALQDRHGWLREAASQALQKIDPSSGGRRVHETRGDDSPS